MRKVIRSMGFAAIVAATISCGDVARSSRSPVYLIINSLQAAPGNKPTALGGNLLSDVLVLLTAPPPCSAATPCPTVFNDVGAANISLAMKDQSIQPTTNNTVTIMRYHVDFRRADGRNTPGVDVPYGFDGGVTATILPNAQTTIGFEIVRHTQKEESPLVQLVNNPAIIHTIATVTFYGTDRVGNEVSVSGMISIDFGDFGDN